MRFILRHTLPTLLTAAATVGCQTPDQGGLPTLPSIDAAVGAAPIAASGLLESHGSPSFQVQLAVEGPFRPGTAMQVTVSVSSNKAVRRAKVELFAPDRLPAGAGVMDGPLANWITPIDSGMTRSFRRTIVFPSEGYYTLQGAITQISGEQSVVFPSRGEAAIAWMLIDRAGGLLTSYFDARRIPLGVYPRPGRFTTQMQPSDTTVSIQLCEPGDPTCGPQRGCCVGGAVTYLEGPNQVLAMRDVLVLMRIYNPATGATLLTQTTRTNTSGTYGGLPCLLSGEAATVTIQTVHARFNVSDSRANTAPTLYPAYSSSCNGTINMYFQTDAAAVYERLLTVTDNELAKYGRLQPWIEVRISDSTSFGPFSYPLSEGKSALTISRNTLSPPMSSDTPTSTTRSPTVTLGTATVTSNTL